MATTSPFIQVLSRLFPSLSSHFRIRNEILLLLFKKIAKNDVLFQFRVFLVFFLTKETDSLYLIIFSFVAKFALPSDNTNMLKIGIRVFHFFLLIKQLVVSCNMLN
jgi:hypothetical protein